MNGWIVGLKFRGLKMGLGLGLGSEEVREERKKKIRRRREVERRRKRVFGVVSLMGRSFFQAFAIGNLRQGKLLKIFPVERESLGFSGEIKRLDLESVCVCVLLA